MSSPGGFRPVDGSSIARVSSRGHWVSFRPEKEDEGKRDKETDSGDSRFYCPGVNLAEESYFGHEGRGKTWLGNAESGVSFNFVKQK